MTVGPPHRPRCHRPGSAGARPCVVPPRLRQDSHGRLRTWHVLDTAPADPVGTLLCVHGNPTWSYLWRSVVARLGDRWRVVAVDHLGMGYSERTGEQHRLADRIAELRRGDPGPRRQRSGRHRRPRLGRLDLAGLGPGPPRRPHRRRPDQHGGEPARRRPAAGPDRRGSHAGRPAHLTVRTAAFVQGTLRLAHPSLPVEVATAYRAPYRRAADRQAIGDFVDDIPLAPTDPSCATLDARSRSACPSSRTCRPCCCGVRATRCSPTATCATCSDDSHRRSRTASRAPVTWWSTTLPWLEAIEQFVDTLAAGRTPRARAAPAVAVDAPPREAPLWSALDARADDKALRSSRCEPGAAR